MTMKKPLLALILAIALGTSGQVLAYGIEWGDNSSRWANDGECDDPRFSGPGRSGLMNDTHLLSDANDCRRLFEQGQIWLDPTTQGSTTLSRITTPQVVALLQDQGFTNIEVDSDNDIIVRMNGYNVLIFARNNNYTNVKFRFTFGPRTVESLNITLDVLNDWNVSKMFTKAYYRESSGSISLEMDLPLRGGVTLDHISQSIQMFDRSMREFLAHVGA